MKLILLQIMFALASVTVPLTHAAEPDEIAEIMSVWKRREDSVQSLQARWVTHQTYHPGSQLGNFDSPVHPPGTALPVETTTVAVSNAFYLRETLWRHDWNGLEWDNRVERFVQQKNWRCFDGKVFRTFAGRDVPDKNELHDHGFIDPPEHQRDGWSQFYAIAAVFRPFANGDGAFARQKVEQVEITGEAVVEGERCSILEFRLVKALAPPDFRIRLWVTRDTERLLRRFESGERTKTQFNYDPQRRSDAILSGWRAEHYRPGTNVVSRVSSTEVEELLINPLISDTVFQPEFPVGTEVTNSTRPGEFGPYLLTAEGERPITAAEQRRKATYEELLRTEPGQALGELKDPAHSQGWWWITICVVGIVAVVVLLTMRNK